MKEIIVNVTIILKILEINMSWKAVQMVTSIINKVIYKKVIKNYTKQ